MVEEIHFKTKIPRTKVKKVLKAFFTSTQDVVRLGEDVKLTKFGRFSPRLIKSKKMFGKMTKARKTVRFVPYKEKDSGQVRRSD